jgi:hypothetical protein
MAGTGFAGRVARRVSAIAAAGENGLVARGAVAP